MNDNSLRTVSIPEEAAVELPESSSPPLQFALSHFETLSCDRTFLEAIPSGVVLIEDTARRVVDYNDRACADLGYSRAEFGDLRLEEILGSPPDVPLPHPPGPASSVSAVMRRRKNGEFCFAEMTRLPLVRDGKEFTVLFLLDVTAILLEREALARQEQYHQALLASLPSAAWLLDTEGRFIAANELYVAAAGLDDPREVRGRHFDAVWPPHLSAKFGQDFTKVMKTQQPVRHEAVAIAINGPERIYSASLAPITWNGNLLGVAGVAHDISDLKETIADLHKLEVQLRTLAENSPDYIVRFDAEGRLLYVNSAFARRMKLQHRNIAGKLYGEVFDPNPGTLKLLDLVDEVRKLGNPREIEIHVPARETDDGNGIRTLHVHVVPEKDEAGRLCGVLTIGRDITHRLELEQRLTERAGQFRALADNSPDFIIRFDSELRRLYANPRAMGVAGGTETFRIGQTPDDGSPVIDLPRYKSLVRRVFETGKTAEAEFQIRMDGGIGTVSTLFAPETDESGRVQSVLSVSRDVSASVEQREHIQRLAFTDTLTGLANRASYQQRLRSVLASEAAGYDTIGLMLLDVDHFKDVNDTRGHSCGDDLLKQIAERLRACVRDSDILARLGGDEFVVLVPRADDAEMKGIADRILDAMKTPFRLEREELVVTCSVGIATVPRNGCDVDDLLRSADEALYEAKRNGRSNAQFYRSELSNRTMERVELGRSLRYALANEEFRLLFQPKCLLSDGRLIGVEALLRWEHPTRGLLTPDQFIEIAEDSGEIVEIGRWVLAQACSIVARLNRRLASPITMAVNISPKQIIAGTLLDHLMQSLERSDCRPEWIEIEITERTFLHGSAGVCETLNAISKAGVSIALDDFGMGHSSFGYIDRFPIDVIKIDRGFISRIEDDPRKASFVRGIIAFAELMELDIVAEGIETAGQADLLRSYGCGIGQGYFYGKPSPMLALLRRYGFCCE